MLPQSVGLCGFDKYLFKHAGHFAIDSIFVVVLT